MVYQTYLCFCSLVLMESRPSFLVIFLFGMLFLLTSISTASIACSGSRLRPGMATRADHQHLGFSAPAQETQTDNGVFILLFYFFFLIEGLPKEGRQATHYRHTIEVFPPFSFHLFFSRLREESYWDFRFRRMRKADNKNRVAIEGSKTGEGGYAWTSSILSAHGNHRRPVAPSLPSTPCFHPDYQCGFFVYFWGSYRAKSVVTVLTAASSALDSLTASYFLLLLARRFTLRQTGRPTSHQPRKTHHRFRILTQFFSRSLIHSYIFTFTSQTGIPTPRRERAQLVTELSNIIKSQTTAWDRREISFVNFATILRRGRLANTLITTR